MLACNIQISCRVTLLKVQKIVSAFKTKKAAQMEFKLNPLLWFSKNVLSQKIVKPSFILTINIIASHTFTEISLKFSVSFRRYEDYLLQY